MCIDPATIAALGAKIGSTLGGMSSTLTVIGTGVSAFTQFQNAQTAKKAAQINAEAQDKAALENLKAGSAESDKKRRQGAAHLASQKAAMAANGVDVASADSLDIMDDTKDMIEADAFTIRENSRQQAQGNATSAANYRADASSAASNSFWAPVSTVLTGAAKVGAKYEDWAYSDVPTGGVI